MMNRPNNARMQRRPLGSTGLLVTPLGLGLAALGRPGYINLGHADDLNDTSVAAMEAHAHVMLDEAWRVGIRYFDAARSYGKAEVFLGSWLNSREIDPNDVTVGSKWGYTYTADWQVNLPEGRKHEIKEHSLEVLERQLGESRFNLNGYLDLYQIHSATLESGVLDNQPVLAELARLRDAGLAVGFTVSGENQAETIWRALDISFGARLLFGTVQATWNLLETSATRALQAAHQAGLGVIIKEALANGRLTPRNQSSDFHTQMALLTQQAQVCDTSVDALALAVCLNQPFVDVVLSGAAQTTHLDSNLKALQVPWDESLMESLQTLQEPADFYWAKRSQLEWN